MREFIFLGLAAFSGALVSGFAGFAFSAAAGAILVRMMPPQEAVPLMMACSIAVQGASLLILRHAIQWRNSLIFIAGGALGTLPALYFLRHVDPTYFRMGFGMLLIVYSTYMLLCPQAQILQHARAKFYDAVVGFAGGLMGGLTAMPGAAPIIWCNLRGMPKDQQRGTVQPFIAFMQVVSIAFLLGTGNMPGRVFTDFAIALPELAGGTVLGIFMFGRVSDLVFRRVVLFALLMSGFSLLLA